MRDIKSTLPAEVQEMLVAGDEVYYYLTGGMGCLGLGGRTLFMFTNSRFVFSNVEPVGLKNVVIKKNKCIL